MDNDIHISIECVFNFSANFYSNSKKWCETQQNLEIEFYSAYPARPSGTVTKYIT